MDVKCLICGNSLMVSDAEDFGDILFGPENKSTKFSDVHYEDKPFVCKHCMAVYFRASNPAKGAKKLEPEVKCPLCKKSELQLVERQDFASVVVQDRDSVSRTIGDVFADEALWCPNCKWLQIAESGVDDSFKGR